nr:TetR family transcriptional regulator [Cohnella sp. AR92]
MSLDDRRGMGLREWKKAKTMAAIQTQAMKLFREKGFNATTVEQIAEAAEVSPSTFFRYFATKEEVVVKDNFDPYLIDAFRDQPKDFSPLQAICRAIPEALDRISKEELDTLRERNRLIMTVPELRSAVMANMLETTQLIVELVAERVGRKSDDLAVRTFAGALSGTVLSVALLHAEKEDSNFEEMMAEALILLEQGLPL